MSDDLMDWMAPIEKRAGELYRALRDAGFRIFVLSLKRDDSGSPIYLLHDQKTVAQWRHDVRDFMEKSESEDDEGGASGDVFNGLLNHLRELGYSEVDDVAVDVFEGRITNERARLIHCPVHEEQPDGFGHFGWEAQPKDL